MDKNEKNCILLFIILNTYTHTLSFEQDDTTFFVFVERDKINIVIVVTEGS